MIDPAKLAAFALVTGTTSLVPGPSMLFVLSQTMWRGGRSGAAALAGLQLGYLCWWLLAALGLGTLAAAFPLAFGLLTIAGAVYLAWLGVSALRHANHADEAPSSPAREPSRYAFRDGILIALGNPKALVYMLAVLPPFLDVHNPIVPQLAVFAVVAALIDIALGAVYIIAGTRLAGAMAQPAMRWRLDIVVGIIFLLLALGILAELFRR